MKATSAARDLEWTRMALGTKFAVLSLTYAARLLNFMPVMNTSFPCVSRFVPFSFDVFPVAFHLP